jgi:outer membrane protein
MSEYMRPRALRASALALFIVLFQVAGMAQAAQAAPAGAAPAGAAAPVAKALDLEAARAGALKSSAALRKAGIAVDSALATEAVQRAAALPSLGASLSLAPQLSGGATSSSGATSYGSISASLSSSMTIWNGGKNAILLAIDALATEAARASAREAYFSAVEDADTAYYAALSARDAADAAKADLDAAALSLSIAQAKLETGTITKAALLKAQAELASKETALGLARNSLQSAMVKLSSITGQGLPFELAAVDFDSYAELMSRLSELDDSGLEAFVGAASASGLKNNPSIATAKATVDKARLAMDSAKADYLPTVSASASAGAKYAIAGTLTPSLSIGISASIPLDYWSAAPALKVKELALGSAGLDLEEARRSLELEVRTAAYSWVAASRTVSSAAKALEYAESNYESVLENYKLSLVAASELSDAALLVSTDRNSLNAAKYGFLKAFAALRSLAGIEKDADLVGLLKE